MTAPAVVGTRERIAYGLGDFGNGLIFNGTTTYLMFFYTERLGLTAAAAGLLLFLARFWDAVVDPVMGVLADRSRSRWGRFRPYLLFVPLPLMLVAVAAYHVPPWGANGRLAWAYVTYFLLMALYSAVNIPYGAMVTVMSRDPQVRAELTSWRMTGSFSSGIVINLAFMPLAAWFAARYGGVDGGTSFAVAVIGAAALAGYWSCFAGVRERLGDAATPELGADIGADLRAAFGSAAWWTLLAMGITMFALSIFPFYAGLYYLKYVVGAEGLAPAYFTGATLGMLAGAISNLWLLKYVGSRRLAVGACLLSAVGALLVLAVPIGQPILLCLMTAGALFAVGVCAPVMWALVGECVDGLERQTGRRMAGLTTSALSFATKFGLGVGGILVGFLLSFSGFVPNAGQQSGTVLTLRLMVSVIPASGQILFAVLLLAFPIGAARARSSSRRPPSLVEEP